MPTVELDIRQLADEGGTAPIAPITVTDAVLDENGDTLTDTLDTLKNGLSNLIKTASITGTTSGTGTLSTNITHRKVIIAKVEATGLDGIAIPVFTYNETNYFKIFYWDMTPVTNTSVTVTYWYMN